jgi:hypothetical protein
MTFSLAFSLFLWGKITHLFPEENIVKIGRKHVIFPAGVRKC